MSRQANPGPTARLTSLIGWALGARIARRARRLGDERFWIANSARLQHAQLRRLLRTAQGTRFGRKHDFGRIVRIADDASMLLAYRRAVPIADWYAFREPISQMREGGEPDVLWPGLVRDFAQTSGTTAGDKFIPLSGAMLRHNYLAALDVYAHAVRFGVSLPRIFAGKILFLGGSTQLQTNEHGIRTGDLSGLATRLIRWPLSTVVVPDRQTALIGDWPTKIERMAQACLRLDVRWISGMPSWSLVLFDKMIQIARDQGRGDDCLRRIWPNLHVFVHGGTRYEPFDGRVRRFWSGDPQGLDIPVRLEVYPASEAFVAIQDRPGDPGLRLGVDLGVFYEFVPLEQIDSDDPLALTCDSVRRGQRYVVVLSSCAGLWRYVLGDVVEFDTVPGGLDGSGGDGPCRLRIVGRHRHFINAFGENLIVDHIESAVSAAARATGLVVGEFTAAPVYPGEKTRAGLELVVEFEGAPDSAALEAFAEAFDRSLKDQNVDYTTKRTADMGMAPPTISPVAPGTFHRWMDGRGKLGGQHKCPRCANTREIAEQILGAAAGGARPAPDPAP